MHPQKNARCFTLIELLIVVAIIAILAAIAVPNFLEAQVRSKTARAKSDLRSIATAHEAYFVDNNTYFCSRDTTLSYNQIVVYNLTSPIAYITSLPMDPFGDRRYGTGSEFRLPFYDVGMGKAGLYTSSRESGGHFQDKADTWFMESAGPDKVDDTNDSDPANGGLDMLTSAYPWLALTNTPNADGIVLGLIYDPTNGNKSRGQIFRAGGSIPGGTSAHQLWFSAVAK